MQLIQSFCLASSCSPNLRKITRLTSSSKIMAHSKSTSSSCALSPSRNLLNPTTLDSTIPVYTALQSSLEINSNERGIKTGPNKAFHNHNAAHIISIFRCGGSADDIRAVLGDSDTSGDKKVVKTNGIFITADNWKNYLGGCGLYGLGAEYHYDSYRTFFQSEISKTSPNETIQKYFPSLIKGCLGDFFHALIELGYYFESGNVSILPNALAWLCTSYIDLGDWPATAVKGSTPLAVLQAASRCDVFPKTDLSNGSSGYIKDMESLLSKKYLQDVSTFDIIISPDDTHEVLMQIQEAARESFAAGGYKDFYTLHSVTGSRAMWAIMKGIEWDAEVEVDMLTVLWRGILLTHIARNNPIITNKDTITEHDLILLPWEEILPWTVSTENSHIVKVIFTFADFYDRTGDVKYWQAATNVMKTRKSGVALEGVGVGTFIDEYVMEYARE